MRRGIALRAFTLARRLLLRGDMARARDAESTATAAALAADARRHGRRALWRYWRAEFTALVAAAIAATRRDPELPDDYLAHAPRRRLMLPALMHDVRYALRLLRRTPGYTAVAVITLALGIGANTAIFSLVNAVLLRPLPFHEPGRIYRIVHQSLSDPSDLASLTPGNFYDLQRDATIMGPMAGITSVDVTMTGRGDPQPLSGVRSVGSVLEVLGVAPLHGRIFTAQDDRPGSPLVLVLSHPAWARLFNSDPSIVGQPVTLNGQPVTVVGIMPAGFMFPTADAEFWTPAQLSDTLRASRTEYMLAGIARLPDAAHIREAEAELQTVMARLRADHPQANGHVGLSVVPLHEALVDGAGPKLWILMASVVAILLIACANLANLMLARASARRREVAVRQAIGAGRIRMVRQLMTEAIVLGALGAAAGLATGYVFLQALIAWLPAGTPRLDAVRIDLPVLAFTIAIAMIASLFFGLAPALQLSRHAPAAVLRDSGGGSTTRSRLRPALVVCEVAIALVLLAGAGLLLRSFQALHRVNPGVPMDSVLTFQVALPRTTYPNGAARTAFIQSMVERLGALPGVQSVAAGSGVPLAGRGTGAWFNIIDRPLPAGQTPPAVPYRVITPEYFRTLGIRLLRGRLLDDGDGLGATPSVVISEAVARRFWPGEDPLGARIYMGAPSNTLFDHATVVGIVNDVKLAGLDSNITEAVYGLQTLMPWWTQFTFALRTTGDPMRLAAPARQQVREVDARMPMNTVRTLEDLQDLSVAPARSSMLLLTIFAAVALVMAAVGVYGVLSFNVTRRAREMGIRMALGADAGTVRRMVVGEGMAQAAGGIVLGLLGAYWLTGFMATLLFQVAPRDPIAFAGAALVLAAVSSVACYLPALRATRVNPLAVLRND